VTAIAATNLERVGFASFATASFLARMHLVLAAVVLFLRVRVTDGTKTAGTDQP